jgi:hypothetical protein
MRRLVPVLFFLAVAPLVWGHVVEPRWPPLERVGTLAMTLTMNVYVQDYAPGHVFSDHGQWVAR